jgi:acyl-coenzyme A thioesterase PaaI-like protein
MSDTLQLDINGLCFACGPDNPIGLKLDFHFEGEDYVTTFEVKPEYQGWRDLAHGGLLATVLDEVMTRIMWAKGCNTVTGRLEVRYRHPAPVGSVLEVRGRITRHRPPLVETEAVATLPDGTVVAEAKSSSLLVSPPASP